jgi:tetratricopeptide (TPR) repeat protein
MEKRNYLFTISTALYLLLIAISAFAENKTFFKEYTYMASDIDSKVSSRAIALEQVKRDLLEQLGTYLISETEVKNYQMTKDQITTLTAGIVSAEVVDEKWDGRTYYLKAMITADPKEVARSVDALRKDVQKNKELEDSKKKAEDAMGEIERLKKELALVKGDTKIQQEYSNAIKDLSAADWYDKGKAFQQSNNLKDAIKAYDKAIELNPKYAVAYYNRGLAYNDLGNHQQSINDYNKAIEFRPKFAWAYNNRGKVYHELGNVQQAISDYNKAIELDPNDALAYNNRGNAYKALRNYQQAFSDYNKAIELDPKYASAYYNRGNAYASLGNYQQAINDYNRAIELNPTYANAYNNRGACYNALGNTNMALEDAKRAARLGSQDAQESLIAAGVRW